MFDVLMYLFETYIHTEAELRVDQDKLEQILPTQDLIEKISTMPCFGWKSLRIIRKDWQNRCNWPLIHSPCVFIPLKSVKGWMPAVVVFCFSLSKFRCLT